MNEKFWNLNKIPLKDVCMDLTDYEINFVSGYGLVPSCNKPFTNAMIRSIKTNMCFSKETRYVNHPQIWHGGPHAVSKFTRSQFITLEIKIHNYVSNLCYELMQISTHSCRNQATHTKQCFACVFLLVWIVQTYGIHLHFIKFSNRHPIIFEHNLGQYHVWWCPGS